MSNEPKKVKASLPECYTDSLKTELASLKGRTDEVGQRRADEVKSAISAASKIATR
jgi:hypothetical protein